MTRKIYKTPDVEALEVDIREILLYSGVSDMGNTDVYQETLDGDIF